MIGRKYFNLIANMGLRYVLYRLYLFFLIRFRIYERKFPVDPPTKKFESLDLWQSYAGLLNNGILSNPSANSRVNSVLDGYRLYFSKQWYFLGDHYDWMTNPLNGYKYNKNLHWTKIRDYSEKDGDIKYVWEPSRFSFIYDVIRYDQHNKTDHSAWVWGQIESWIAANPINRGPNYKCSQEISLRVLNWVYGLNYYRYSGSLTEEKYQIILNAIYWQMKHVYDNIHFSRVAVRNNHAITETLALYIVGSLFPSFDCALKWRHKGKKWFEKEIIYQIYKDGTYLQFSHNYHRVVVQLLNMAFMIAEKTKDYFHQLVYDRAYASLDFLYHAQDEYTGYLSNYGSNDGALFFPFTECDFRDFRPQLQTLHIFLTGEALYEDGPWNEEVFFMNAKLHSPVFFKPIIRRGGWNSYPVGGFYILREQSTVTVIRCGGYKDRPAQADNLHIDIWHEGRNILYDGGSYQYNTDRSTIEYFCGTRSHNSVMLNDYDQMLKGPRFIWYFWTSVQSVAVSETDDSFIFKGGINAFRFVKKGIVHERVVCKKKGELVWKISDIVHGLPEGLQIKQIWHVDESLKISSSTAGSGKRVVPQVKNGYVSNYYGIKEHAPYFECQTTEPVIKTELRLYENTINSSVLLGS
ncbi:alginate lyase family protein [Sediminibacterium soli]|uniref:alginate lyase family protein n=1 Tax=Sediminibacterium soli TaxID=2698829 RepID=UPI00137B6042|nr:alginate lyase family protein [Sediminibacterium soli]NCI48067.1 heparinase [Sediminibacterium soli]